MQVSGNWFTAIMFWFWLQFCACVCVLCDYKPLKTAIKRQFNYVLLEVIYYILQAL